jgi:hypothetical protein
MLTEWTRFLRLTVLGLPLTMLLPRWPPMSESTREPAGGAMRETRSEFPKLRMSVDAYGEAIRAAFEEGYVQGAAHTKGRSVILEGRRIGLAFWERVKSGMMTGAGPLHGRR